MPVLIGYVGGYGKSNKLELLGQVLLFMVGVSITLAILGILASLLGIAFGGLVGSGWYYFVGAVAIVMGLQLLGVINIPLPQTVARLPETNTGQWLTPLLLGATFGIATSPCGTPFLTAMLGFISKEKNIALGGLSLFAYGLGQSVLLLVIGLFAGLMKHIATVRRVGSVLNQLSAIIFILAGILFIALGAGWLEPFALY